MKRQPIKQQKTKKKKKKGNIQIFDILIQRVDHIPFIMNIASTWSQEHLPKFDLMFNRRIYFREKKRISILIEIKITKPDQFTF